MVVKCFVIMNGYPEQLSKFRLDFTGEMKSSHTFSYRNNHSLPIETIVECTNRLVDISYVV